MAFYMLGLTLIYSTSYIFFDIWLTVVLYFKRYVESQVVNVNDGKGKKCVKSPGGSVLKHTQGLPFCQTSQVRQDYIRT